MSCQARLNMYGAALQDILDKVHLRNTNKRRFTILNSVSGVIKPGVFTLLLGPPGSGKTTLLTALAGKLQGVGGVKVRGADLPNHCCALCNAGRGPCPTLLADLAVRLQAVALNDRERSMAGLCIPEGQQ